MVVKLAIGPNRAVSRDLRVMRLVGHIYPRLNHGFGRRLNVLSIVVALLVKGRRGVPLASKIDGEQDSGECEDDDNSNNDADDGGCREAFGGSGIGVAGTVSWRGLESLSSLGAGQSQQEEMY